MSDYTTAEMIVVAMARQVCDGECLAQGIGTNMPNAALLLAKRMHAPNAVVLFSVGGVFGHADGPLMLEGMEAIALRSPLRRVSYPEIVCEQLAGMAFREFARPAQVDRFGNTNNVLVNRPDGSVFRFPGVGGLPDFNPYGSYHGWLYVPRHDRAALVERLDFVSAVGAGPPAGRPAPPGRADGPGYTRMFTDLGIFDFHPDAGASAVSLHPGVTPELVRERSGFEIAIATDVAETSPPSDDELRLIREEIDPLGLRELELVPGRERLALIRSVLERERTLLRSQETLFIEEEIRQ